MPRWGNTPRGITRRVAQGLSVEQAYHRLKSKLFHAMQIWQKEIDEIREEAKNNGVPLTEQQINAIAAKQVAKNSERHKLAETEKLEEEGWHP